MYVLNESGVCVEIMLTILGLVANMIGGDLYDHLMSKGILTLIVH
jgi:hypothetical protein